MIVYTVRGGVSAVIWTDVVQMFVYIAGAAAVAVALLDAHSRRLGRRSSRPAARPASSRCSTCRSISSRAYTLLGGPARRRRADAGDARHRSVPGAAAAVGAQRARSRARPDPERLHRLRAVHPVPADRRDAVRLLPADAAAAAARARRTRSCPLFVVSALDARPRRLHRRGDRRRGAVAVAQRDGRDDGQRLLPALRATRTPIRRRRCACRGRPRSAGASCSSASRSARSGWIARCSTPGLPVLSFASGAVLGAFLLGTLMPRVARARRAGRHDRRAWSTMTRRVGVDHASRSPGTCSSARVTTCARGAGCCRRLAPSRGARRGRVTRVRARRGACSTRRRGARAFSAVDGGSRARSSGPLWHVRRRTADLRRRRRRRRPSTRSSISRR